MRVCRGSLNLCSLLPLGSTHPKVCVERWQAQGMLFNISGATNVALVAEEVFSDRWSTTRLVAQAGSYAPPPVSCLGVDV